MINACFLDFDKITKNVNVYVNIHNGSAFKEQGLQISAGVPLVCGEADSYRTFRIGLFGLDKWQQVDKTLATFKTALDAIVAN